MDEEKVEQMKRQMAKECIENNFFQFTFNMYFNTINEGLDNLSPGNKEQFTIYQSQRFLLKDLYNTFVNAAEEKVEDESKTHIL